MQFRQNKHNILQRLGGEVAFGAEDRDRAEEDKKGGRIKKRQPCHSSRLGRTMGGAECQLGGTQGDGCGLHRSRETKLVKDASLRSMAFIQRSRKGHETLLVSNTDICILELPGEATGPTRAQSSSSIQQDAGHCR